MKLSTSIAMVASISTAEIQFEREVDYCSDANLSLVITNFLSCIQQQHQKLLINLELTVICNLQFVMSLVHAFMQGVAYRSVGVLECWTVCMYVCTHVGMYVHEHTRTDKGCPLGSQLTTEVVMRVGCGLWVEL
jgi:hypothetical protein